MARKSSLTIKELKSLLKARSKFEAVVKTGLEKRIQEALGISAKDKEPGSVVLEEKLYEMMDDLIARRLKANRRSVPLISHRDLRRMNKILLDGMASSDPDFGSEDRRVLEMLMNTVSENILKEVARFADSKDIYEKYWQWIDAVLQLASERGVALTEVFLVDGVYDELTRRVYTKREFRSSLTKNVNMFLSVKTFKRMIFQPIIEIFAEGDKEELREMKQEFERKIIPKIKENIAKIKPIIKVYANEEVARIWST